MVFRYITTLLKRHDSRSLRINFKIVIFYYTPYANLLAGLLPLLVHVPLFPPFGWLGSIIDSCYQVCIAAT